MLGDVSDRPCLIIDDMTATGGTIAETVRALRKTGVPSNIMVAATHGVFVDGALDSLAEAGVQMVFI